MATCKWCGKSGWLLKTSANGLCNPCEVVHIPSIVRQVQILQESQELVKSGKTVKTRLGRCDDVVRIASELIRYEEKGITVIDPPAAELRVKYITLREEILVDHVQTQTQKILTRAELKSSPRSAVAEARKALVEIDAARNEHGIDSPVLDILEHLVHEFTHKTELRGYLGEAEKAEFKGNKKKALDQYQEALFFLKKDHIDDSKQEEEIRELEAKIERLMME